MTSILWDNFAMTKIRSLLLLALLARLSEAALEPLGDEKVVFRLDGRPNWNADPGTVQGTGILQAYVRGKWGYYCAMNNQNTAERGLNFGETHTMREYFENRDLGNLGGFKTMNNICRSIYGPESMTLTANVNKTNGSHAYLKGNYRLATVGCGLKQGETPLVRRRMVDQLSHIGKPESKYVSTSNQEEISVGIGPMGCADWMNEATFPTGDNALCIPIRMSCRLPAGSTSYLGTWDPAKTVVKEEESDGCYMKKNMESGEFEFKSVSNNSEWREAPYGTKVDAYQVDSQGTNYCPFNNPGCTHFPNDNKWGTSDRLRLRCGPGFFYKGSGPRSMSFRVRCEHDDWWNYEETQQWYYHDQAHPNGVQSVPHYNYQCRPCGFKGKPEDADICGPFDHTEDDGTTSTHCENYIWDATENECKFEASKMEDWVGKGQQCSNIEDADCWFRKSTYLLVSHRGDGDALKYLCPSTVPSDGTQETQNRKELHNIVYPKNVRRLKQTYIESVLRDLNLDKEDQSILDRIELKGCPTGTDSGDVPIDLSLELDFENFTSSDVTQPGKMLFNNVVDDQVFEIAFSECNSSPTDGCLVVTFNSEPTALRRLAVADNWSLQGTLIIPEAARAAGVPVSSQSFPWWAGLIIGVVVLGGVGGGLYYWWSNKADSEVAQNALGNAARAVDDVEDKVENNAPSFTEPELIR